MKNRRARHDTQTDKLKELGFSTVSQIFYYTWAGGRLVGPSGARVSTVCLLVDFRSEEEFLLKSRGVAICSPSDQFVKKVGRAKALGRAIQALARKETTGLIANRQTRDGFNPCILSGWTWKSRYMPLPDQYEQELIRRQARALAKRGLLPKNEESQERG